MIGGDTRPRLQAFLDNSDVILMQNNAFDPGLVPPPEY